MNIPLQFYWYDACELYSTPSTIYLFGKTIHNNAYLSSCIQVKNLQRNLFIKCNLDIKVHINYEQLCAELKTLLNNHNIHHYKFKGIVSRLTPFNLININENNNNNLGDWEGHSPSSFLHLTYSFDYKPLDRNISGNTFHKIFGTQSSALELFILSHKLKGPSWLSITDYQEIDPLDQSDYSSFCRREYIVENQLSIGRVVPLPTPCLSLLSFNMKITNKQEIMMISYLVHPSISMDESTDTEIKTSTHTIINNSLQKKFDLQKIGRQTTTIVANEIELLKTFMKHFIKFDPDCVLNHNLYKHTIDLLLRKLLKYNINTWKHWGKLKRPDYWLKKNLDGPHYGNKIIASGIGVGRLQIDSMDCAEKFISHQTDYSISYLAETQLNLIHDPILLHTITQYYESTDELSILIKSNEMETWLYLQLIFKMMIIPLTKHITNICGLLWSKALRSVSERVEYLLLHEFYRYNCIVPEKPKYKEREDSSNKKRKKKEAKYIGGLVLEPKSGFYDKSVLLLFDFNSLYPSIIQEFNICFTTVNYWDIDSKVSYFVPDLPDSNSKKGLLPDIIGKLIKERQSIKLLLKQEQDNSKKTALDIRQKALKLIANALYGCLGFANSRFYCEPIAALITQQGRKVLQHAVDITNKSGGEVIYGDTDSIMIQTNEIDIEQAILAGQKIKDKINSTYKILEIDLDSIFKNMLLLKKKKYAALKIDPTTKIVTREIKGLDMVRRDWSGLSKKASDYILSCILSTTNSRQEIVIQIYEYLKQLKLQLIQNKIDKSDFIITKRITKLPNEYTDIQPHVQVSLQLMKQGQVVKPGDFIPYVMTEIELDPSTKNYDAFKAADPNNDSVTIDINWYLIKQILPPIARLCEPIHEVEYRELGNCLGLVVKLNSNDLLNNNNNNNSGELKGHSPLDASKQLLFSSIDLHQIDIVLENIIVQDLFTKVNQQSQQ